MAGLLTPVTAKELVQSIKRDNDIKIEMHTHCTVGTGQLAYLGALEAGADIFDTATAPLSGASSQPPVEAMYQSFKEYKDLDVHLDDSLFTPIADYFETIREKHAAVDANIKHINIRVLSSQVPGGMLSNLINQLREQKALDKLKDVLDEIPVVRKDLGYPPLVTPTSQMVGVQSVMNVLLGERYKKITREVKAYMKGFYGRPPAPMNEALVKATLGDEKCIDKRPADYLEPMMDRIREESGHLAVCDEDLLSLALFPDVASKFLKNRYFGDIRIDRNLLEDNEGFEGIYPFA
jgi:oxaloacetate decarboxylase alpha subunit